MNHQKIHCVLINKARSGEIFLQANKISGISNAVSACALAMLQLLQRPMCVYLSYSDYFKEKLTDNKIM